MISSLMLRMPICTVLPIWSLGTIYLSVSLLMLCRLLAVSSMCRGLAIRLCGVVAACRWGSRRRRRGVLIATTVGTLLSVGTLLRTLIEVSTLVV